MSTTQQNTTKSRQTKHEKANIRRHTRTIREQKHNRWFNVILATTQYWQEAIQPGKKELLKIMSQFIYANTHAQDGIIEKKRKQATTSLSTGGVKRQQLAANSTSKINTARNQIRSDKFQSLATLQVCSQILSELLF